MVELRFADLSRSREVVLCGYRDPMERFKDLKECAKWIHNEFEKP